MARLKALDTRNIQNRIVGSAHKVASLLFLVLQVCGMTAFAEETLSGTSRKDGKETTTYNEGATKTTMVTRGGRIETITTEHTVGKETTTYDGIKRRVSRFVLQDGTVYERRPEGWTRISKDEKGNEVTVRLQARKGPQFPTIDKLPNTDEFLWSKLPLPSQKMLDNVLSKLKRVRVIDCAVDLEGRPYSGAYGMWEERLSGNIVFESADANVLKELTKYLRISEQPENKQVDAYESADPAIELTLFDGRVVYLGFARGFIRWREWRYDAHLLNPLGFALWLNKHGVTRPLPRSQGVEYDYNDYNRWEYEQQKKAFDAFVRTMPTSLRSFFRTKLVTRLGPGWSKLETRSKIYEKISDEQFSRLVKAELSRQFPKVPDQIGVLLEWDGKLDYSKIGLEHFPIQVLLEYAPSQVLTKVTGPSLSPLQWVGVSRYYSSYDFRQKFPSGYKPLDKALIERITKGVKASGKCENLPHFENAMSNW